jgi:uncharacterized protein YybS (DUF2232 family)
MNGVVAASTLVSAILALVVGVSMQSPSSRQRLAAALRNASMGRVLSAAALILIMVSALGQSASLPLSLLVVLGAGFAVQGFSVLHCLAHARSWPPLWAPIFYLPLLLSPPIAAAQLALAAIIGLLDNVVSLRRAPANVVK